MSQSTAGRASFVLSTEMRNYTDKIGFETKVHPYYYFMMLGFAHGKKGDIRPMNKDMVDRWKLGNDSPNDVEVIAAVAFYEFCKDKGVVSQARDDRILDQMKIFFHPNSKKFTPEAYVFMNQYAQGGFEVMVDFAPSNPEDVYSFLLTFFSLYGE